MALWTPYADEVALDLSKTIKEETNLSKYELPYPPQESQYPVFNFGYSCAPVPQMSPISSVSSYDVAYNGYSPSRAVALSPPQSPVPHDLKPYTDELSDDPDFQAFERDALRSMAEKNGGSLLGNNPKMRRAVRSSNDSSDDSYRKQRERNNFAAKQSRDRRKLREIHLALKVTYLRKEVAGLKAMLAGRVCSRCQQSYLC